MVEIKHIIDDVTVFCFWIRAAGPYSRIVTWVWTSWMS